MRNSKWILGAALITTVFLSTAWGVDGVILIDQNRALAGNVTPGDAPGFPVTISQPGSYRLSTNLLVPSGLNGISITSSKVTIDLNGFSIMTPDVTTFPPFFYGIRFEAPITPSFIIIRNGTIDGFTVPISLFGTNNNIPFRCSNCTLMDLNTRVPVGTASLDLGQYSRVVNVTASRSSLNAICPSVVTNSVLASVSAAFAFPGDPNPPNVGSCTFAHNSTEF
jgi:hypothetical protein